jgi:hypothetical protein
MNETKSLSNNDNLAESSKTSRKKKVGRQLRGKTLTVEERSDLRAKLTWVSTFLSNRIPAMTGIFGWFFSILYMLMFTMGS